METLDLFAGFTEKEIEAMKVLSGPVGSSAGSYSRSESCRSKNGEATRSWWASLSEEERKRRRELLSASQKRRWAKVSEKDRLNFSHTCSSRWTSGMRLEASKRLAKRNSERAYSEKLLAGKRGGEASKLFWLTPGNDKVKDIIKEKIVKKVLSCRGMTQPEVELDLTLKDMTKDYKFNDGWFVLGGKVPDFVNVNGKKKLIELFGSYWHSEDEVEQRIAYFREFGYSTLILWDWEIGTRGALARLDSFIFPWYVRAYKQVRRWLPLS